MLVLEPSMAAAGAEFVATRQGRAGKPWLRVRARMVRLWKLEGTPCWLCHRPIDWDLPRRDPMGGTADHLVPISRGGSPLDPGNLMPAHMVCNSRRGIGEVRTTSGVHLIAGPPCSGKTTLAHQLSMPGETVLDFDAICVELGSPPGWEHTTHIRQRAGTIMDQRIHQLRGTRGNSYLIRCAPGRHQRDRIAKALGAAVRVLDPGMDECLRRAREDQRPKGTYSAIKRWYATYQPSSGGVQALVTVRDSGPNPEW